MMGLMIHEREELERLRVCVVEQAAAIERLDDEIRKCYRQPNNDVRHAIFARVEVQHIYFD